MDAHGYIARLLTSDSNSDTIISSRDLARARKQVKARLDRPPSLFMRIIRYLTGGLMYFSVGFLIGALIAIPIAYKIGYQTGTELGSSTISYFEQEAPPIEKD